MSHPILADQLHRTWALPDRPWIMEQHWHDLLFMHWRFPPETIAAQLPPGLTLDTFEDSAWLGVVPFHMSHITLRGIPALPRFPELNVRTYVTAQGKPGVWFFSLDAANRLAVEGARFLYHLPYFNARMQAKLDGDQVHTVSYSSQRTDRRIGGGELRVRYRPTAPPFLAQPGTLDYFLSERYCLYAASPRGTLYRADIHHAPWELQPAEAEIEVNTVTDAHGLPLSAARTSGKAPTLRYARIQKVLAWLPERVR